jgi:crossover junction endodeoxyribonuclease RuvC
VEARQALNTIWDAVTESMDQPILGIDPGLNITGYAVVRKQGSSTAICEAGVVRSTRGGTLESRLAEIFEGVRDVIASFTPAAVAVEELYSHYERPRTAILMGHARGVICLAASLAGIPVQPYAATQVKRLLTGSGRAPKAQIQKAVCREFGLSEVPEPADVADALAIAVCHLHHTHSTIKLT